MATGDGSPNGDAPTKASSEPFDIVATYHHLLATNPALTESVAAIEALIALLKTTSSSTVHETTVILKRQSRLLVDGVENSLALSAGTDLFLRYLVSSLKQQERDIPITPQESFDERLRRLLRSGRAFADRALDARDKIAGLAAELVGDGKVVFTHGASRAVAAALIRAARRRRRGSSKTAASDGVDGPGAVRRAPFRVVYISDHLRPAENEVFVAQLRAEGIPVAVVPANGAAHCLNLSRPQNSLCLVGAEVVTSNGGAISRMGTFQLACLARYHGSPFYVLAETHKMVKRNVFGQEGMARGERSISQTVLVYKTADGEGSELSKDLVDYTPEDLITQLVTENGRKAPSYVFGLLLDTYDTLISESAIDKLQDMISNGTFGRA